VYEKTKIKNLPLLSLEAMPPHSLTLHTWAIIGTILRRTSKFGRIMFSRFWETWRKPSFFTWTLN